MRVRGGLNEFQSLAMRIRLVFKVIISCRNIMCSIVDINECTSGQAECAQNALCTNTDGSYSCKCQPGYTGDPVKTCTGML